ncbi:unnamed protein product [Heligmosomoides polygyrus]|uniref:Uncharacterized protein n=1 Tax=Heligmosomoides polygyrus TaxID=6339 RepID=A0A183G7A4_HELPZ|nr:unnamed protein product [Heligmosomoides polygyrus]
MFRTAASVCTGEGEGRNSWRPTVRTAQENSTTPTTKIPFLVPFVFDEASTSIRKCLRRSGLENLVAVIDLPPDNLKTSLRRGAHRRKLPSSAREDEEASGWQEAWASTALGYHWINSRGGEDFGVERSQGQPEWGIPAYNAQGQVLPHSRILTGDFKVQASPTDGVVVSAKDVAVPSQTSFAQLVGYRGDTKHLSYGVAAKILFSA